MNDKHDPKRRSDPDEHSVDDARAASTGGWQISADEPADLSEVRFDDEFIDALANDLPTTTRDATEYELAQLLSSWRYDVVAAPVPRLPGIDEIERAIADGRVPRRRRVVRTLRVVAGAAAIAVVAAAGLTVMSEGSAPGDPLWSVKRVVFAQAASQTQAAYDVRANLAQAEIAIAAGNTSSARTLISRAQSSLGPVRDRDTRSDLDARISRLRADAGVPVPSPPAATSSTRNSGHPVTPGRDNPAHGNPTHGHSTRDSSTQGSSALPGSGSDSPITPPASGSQVDGPPVSGSQTQPSPGGPFLGNPDDPNNPVGQNNPGNPNNPGNQSNSGDQNGTGLSTTPQSPLPGAQGGATGSAPTITPIVPSDHPQTSVPEISGQYYPQTLQRQAPQRQTYGEQAPQQFNSDRQAPGEHNPEQNPERQNFGPHTHYEQTPYPPGFRRRQLPTTTTTIPVPR
ncbi:MAG: anti-sigma-D factor RsdA [Gordonia sp. (in: high G+C Gram-positive bacteria)]